MARSKQTQSKNKQTDDKLTLQDTLNQDILLKLKHTQQQLKQDEESKKKFEEERKREERRQKDKNKSFEELLNENPMDWKKYK